VETPSGSACLVGAEVMRMQLSYSACLCLLVLCERAEHRHLRLHLTMKSLLDWLPHSSGALLSLNLWKYVESWSLHR